MAQVGVGDGQVGERVGHRGHGQAQAQVKVHASQGATQLGEPGEVAGGASGRGVCEFDGEVWDLRRVDRQVVDQCLQTRTVALSLQPYAFKFAVLKVGSWLRRQRGSACLFPETLVSAELPFVHE